MSDEFDFGFSVRAGNHPHRCAVAEFLGMTGRFEVTKTLAEWAAFRDGLEREGFIVHEVSHRVATAEIAGEPS